MDYFKIILDILDKNGKITDKKIAIELLKRSPKVWNLLSDELKKDVEVILYHQPNACVYWYRWVEHSRWGVKLIQSSGIICEPGFIAEYNRQTDYEEYSSDCISDEVIYSEGIDDSKLKEVYRNLQRKIKSENERISEPSNEFYENNISKSPYDDIDYYERKFNTENIDILVQEALNEYEQQMGEEHLRRR